MKKIRLGNTNIYTIVDNKDYISLSKKKWFFSTGYAKRNEVVANKKISIGVLMHRVITNAPDKLCVDHINGDRLDNRRKNLRLCSIRENNRNVKIRKDSKTGIKGVSFDKRRKKYFAYISLDNRRYNLGYFNSKEEAGKKYNNMATVLHKKFALLNKL